MRVRVTLVAVLAGLVASLGTPAEGADPRPEPATRAAVRHALEVLDRWDVRRAGAWAHADEAALRSLYLPGSGAGAADVRLLRAYSARGLVVRRIVTQVFGVRVLRHDPGRITIRVLDRVAGGRVVDGKHAVPLPSSRPAMRRIEFERFGGAWKVVRVTG